MNSVETLLEQYKAEHRTSGDVDPRPYLAKVAGVERAELAAHIDRFLTISGSRLFNPAAFARFRDDAARNELVSRILDAPTLRELVKASGLKRAELIRRVAGRLGLVGHETKVRGRLRDIENGDVPVDRVRPSVWDALAEVIGESADRVQRAAENAIAERGLGASAAPGFARQSRRTDELCFSVADAAINDDDDHLVDAAFFLD